MQAAVWLYFETLKEVVEVRQARCLEILLNRPLQLDAKRPRLKGTVDVLPANRVLEIRLDNPISTKIVRCYAGMLCPR